MKSNILEYLIDKHIDIEKYGKEYVYGKYYEITIEIMARKKKK